MTKKPEKSAGKTVPMGSFLFLAVWILTGFSGNLASIFATEEVSATATAPAPETQPDSGDGPHSSVSEPLPSFSPQQEVENVKKNLNRSVVSGYPWYDAKADSLKPVPLPVEKKEKEKYEKVDTATHQRSNNSAFFQGMRTLVIIVLSILAGVFLLALGYWGAKMWNNWATGKSALTKAEEDARRRAEALPDEVEGADGNLFTLAKQAFEAGDYRMVVIILFSLQLTQLDEYKRIHLLKGRTNRQYQKAFKRSLRKQFTEHYEAISINATDQQRLQLEDYRRQGEEAEAAFADTMYLFEETFYGQRPPTRQQAEACFEFTTTLVTALLTLDKRVRREHSPWAAPVVQKVGGVYIPGFDARQSRCWWVPVLLAATLCASGCQRTINTEYGKISSYNGSDSVVGTKVFADLVESGGARVSVENSIKKRKFNRRDSVVWFVLSWDDISPDAYQWAEEWLQEGNPETPRTFLTVYRAYDGVQVYFDQMMSQVDKEQKQEMEKWQVSPRGAWGAGSSHYYQNTSSRDVDRWVLHKDPATVLNQKKITSLTGDPYWTAGIRVGDANLWTLDCMKLNEKIMPSESKAGLLGEMKKVLDTSVKKVLTNDESSVHYDEDTDEFHIKTDDGKGITLKNFMEYNPPKNPIPADELLDCCRCLLSSQGGKPFLVERVYKNDKGEITGRWYAVANASFLTNTALVNHENRKLAHRVATVVGGKEKRVVFLQQDSDPYIYEGVEVEEDHTKIMPAGWEMFEVYPLKFILFHITALTIFYVFYMFPIFGRPRRIFVSAGSRFGEHIRAVGRLLRRQ